MQKPEAILQLEKKLNITLELHNVKMHKRDISYYAYIDLYELDKKGEVIVDRMINLSNL